MIKRRAAAADLPVGTCCHMFRATDITAYLSNGGTLEHAQQIAAHASPKTTKLYDRTTDTISLDEIERIVIGETGRRSAEANRLRRPLTQPSRFASLDRVTCARLSVCSRHERRRHT